MWLMVSRCSRIDFPAMVTPSLTTSAVSCRVSVFPSMRLLSYVYSMASASSIFFRLSAGKGRNPDSLFFSVSHSCSSSFSSPFMA